MKKLLGTAAMPLLLLISVAAHALPISAQLTGDLRLANPDNLIVDVSITQTGANTVQWVIDINSPLHPNIKLDEFYFSLVGPASNYSFGGFNPSGWAISTPASVQGLGGTSFMFEALDPPGPPNAADVTNSTNLVFTMTVSNVALTDALFTGGASTCSNDIASWCGQMGAHLQSLSVPAGSGQSDSGFALGNFVPPRTVPEPSTLALLLAIGVLGSFTRRRCAN